MQRTAPKRSVSLTAAVRLAACAVVGLAAVVVVFGKAAAQERADPPAPMIDAATDQAVDLALKFLAERQHEDGSIGSGPYRQNIAVTSLAGLAWMSGGNTPGRGKYGPNVERAVDFVLEKAGPSGYLVVPSSTSHGPMYDHGFGTLFLAEAYGMSHRADIHEKLQKAVRLIVDTQNNEGGWRYQPVRRDADISVTICQIMALRAARNAGIFVPKNTVEKCIDYVKRSQNPDGGFRYMIHSGSSAFPRSAAGVVALYSAGIYEGPEIQRGLEYLMQHLPDGRDQRRVQSHYFYGHYYAAQAAWQAGGTYWQRWYPAIRNELLQSQQKDGSWTIDSICVEYGTAMAGIILQMPNNYLPIFQR